MFKRMDFMLVFLPQLERKEGRKEKKDPYLNITPRFLTYIYLLLYVSMFSFCSMFMT